MTSYACDVRFRAADGSERRLAFATASLHPSGRFLSGRVDCPVPDNLLVNFALTTAQITDLAAWTGTSEEGTAINRAWAEHYGPDSAWHRERFDGGVPRVGLPVLWLPFANRGPQGDQYERGVVFDVAARERADHYTLTWQVTESTLSRTYITLGAGQRRATHWPHREVYVDPLEDQP